MDGCTCREQIDGIHALQHTNPLTSFSIPSPPIFFLLLLLDLVLGTILMAYGSMPLPLFVAAPRQEYTPEKLPPSCALLCHGSDRGRKDIHVNRVRMRQRRKGKRCKANGDGMYVIKPPTQHIYVNLHQICSLRRHAPSSQSFAPTCGPDWPWDSHRCPGGGCCCFC